jgi:hypothetical protein
MKKRKKDGDDKKGDGEEERTGERKAQTPTMVAWKIVDRNQECF